MTEDKEKQLDEELQEFEAEQEKVRKVVGQIGGSISPKREKFITFAFLLALIVIFALDLSRHLFGIGGESAPLFSLEVAVLLVSMKIIWMIHKQSKVEHFQFWMLNSIEFRLNEVSKQLREVQERLEENLNTKTPKTQRDAEES